MALFDELETERIEEMLEAGAEIEECYRVLRKVDANIVGEILKGHGTFYEWDHYPPGDVFDDETHCQYYYHSHRPEGSEHGHFHTFVRAGALPAELTPVAHEGEEEWPADDDRIAHIVAIAMEKRGYPTHLFTTNRWVTCETFHDADGVIGVIDRFDIDHAYPSWPANRWLTAMVKLFRPQIELLLRQRDEKIGEWAAAHPGADVYEERELEVTSKSPISITRQIKTLQKALRGRR